MKWIWEWGYDELYVHAALIVVVNFIPVHGHAEKWLVTETDPTVIVNYTLGCA